MSLFSLLKNKLSVRNTACVILVLFVTFGVALKKLLGRLIEAVDWLDPISNDRSLESIFTLIFRSENVPRLALKV